MRTLDKLVVICFSPPDVKGEISLLISLAEAWLAQGKRNFNLKIISCGETDIAIEKQVSPFTERLKHLQANGISTLIYGNRTRHAYSDFAIAEQENSRYHAGLIYPMPAMADAVYSAMEKICKVLLPDLVRKKRIFHSSGLANFQFCEAAESITGYTLASVPDTDKDTLTLLQPPICGSTAAVSTTTPSGNYYALYTNPILVDPSEQTVSYEDAFCIFIADSLKHTPDDNIIIQHNNIKAASIQNFTAMVPKILSRFPALKAIEFTCRKPDGTIKLLTAKKPTGTITVTINTFPSMSNSDFINYMASAKIAAVNTSGCYDEMLQRCHPALMIDNCLMRRKENMLAILKREHNPECCNFEALIDMVELQCSLLTADKEEKEVIYDSLVDYFNEPKRSLIKQQLQQFKDITSKDYNLARTLYQAIAKPHSPPTSTHTRHRVFHASPPATASDYFFEPTPTMRTSTKP
ncbi:MAG: hypothetical protein P1U40_06965 [Coxiellaceae bacterium]|nr:hypothetical protein [Coxiellaceae bacterium]